MASVTNKVSMENLVPETSFVKSQRAYKILALVAAVSFTVAVVMTALFIWQLAKSPPSSGLASNKDLDDSSWPANGWCPKMPLLLPLPSPLPKELKETLQEINSYLESLVTDNGLPAISANMFYRNQIIWTGHYGKKTLGGEKPDDKTRYRIGSITKVFTVLMLYKMFEQGLVDSIDDPLSKYAPNFHINNPFNGENITLRQIANQLSGLPREAPCVTCVANETTEEQLLYLRNRSLVAEPGTMPSYSNLAYALLGRILPEKLKKTKYELWVKENILRPLEMSNTGFDITEEVKENMAFSYDKSGKIIPFMNIGWLSPSGQMYSTIEDMANFGMFVVGNEKKKKILKKSSLREILAPVNIAPDGQALFGSSWEMVFHKNFLVRSKGGAIDDYLAMFSLVPELEFGFNVFVSCYRNATSGSRIVDDILNRVYRMILPVFNTTLYELNTKAKFPGTASVFCGAYNATQVNVISGEVTNFLATIKEKDVSLTFTSPDLTVSLFYMKSDSVLQGRRYSFKTCRSQMLVALLDFYFKPKGPDGKSPGFTVPGEGISAIRIPDR